MTDNNTLNDTKYDDINIRNGKEITEGAPVAPGPEYDYVLSFFQKVMDDDGTAATFAQAIYEVAVAIEVPVLTILETLNTENEMTLSESMAYYLNSLRSPSTLLGVENPIRPNYYAGRNVLG